MYRKCAQGETGGSTQSCLAKPKEIIYAGCDIHARILTDLRKILEFSE